MSYIWWAISAFGVGGLLLIGAIIIFGWPVIIGTRIGRMLLAIGAGVAAVFGVYLKGRSEGEQGEKDKAVIRHAKNVKIAKEESVASKARSPSEARKRMKGRRK